MPTPTNIQNSMDELIHQKNYPCVPALLSLQQGEYQVGVYSKFGTGHSAERMHQELIAFKNRQQQSKSLYLSYWAVFEEDFQGGESAFEDLFWEELSHLCAKEQEKDWDPQFSSDPKDPKFCISLAGSAYFVVGLHSQSSRRARKFPYPAIVFNLYEQFEELDRLGKYQSIVKNNRKREMLFQGSLNPMVEKYGDKWESIQFSGKENSSEWKCPFHKTNQKT